MSNLDTLSFPLLQIIGVDGGIDYIPGINIHNGDLRVEIRAGNGLIHHDTDTNIEWGNIKGVLIVGPHHADGYFLEIIGVDNGFDIAWF